MRRIQFDGRSIFRRRLGLRRVACAVAAGVGIAGIVAFCDSRTAATTDTSRAMPASAREPRFVEIPVRLPSKAEMFPEYLNNRDQILGVLLRDSNGKLYDSNERVAFWNGRRLSTRKGFTAQAVNDSGQYLDFLGVGRTELANSEGATLTPAMMTLALNNRSQVLGLAWDDNGNVTPLLWDHGKLNSILYGLTDLAPKAMNDRGEVLAIDHDGAFNSAGFGGKQPPTVYLLDPLQKRWNRINLVDFLPTPQLAYEERTFLLNNNGQILVSYSALGNEHSVAGNRHSFVWANGGITPISAPDLALRGEGLNDAGQVIGRYWPRHGRPSPFLWQEGRFYDLNALLTLSHIAPVDAVKGINNAGHILALRNYANGCRTVLLGPAPAR